MKKMRVWILTLFIILSIIGCGRREKIIEIDLSDTVKLKETSIFLGPEINICVGSMITPKEGYVYYKELLDYIGKHLKLKVNFIEKESYSQTNNLLLNGKVDVAFVCGGPYIDGHDEFGLELLAAPEVDGKALYYSYIIVRKDSDIKKFEDLKGRSFVFVDPMSNTGMLYPAYLISQMQESPEVFFGEYSYSYAHDTSIRAVAEGIADAAAVDSLVWDYLEKTGSSYTRNTRIIQRSQPFGIPPVVVRPGLKKDLKEKISHILFEMHKDAKGKAILNKMKIDKFVQVDDSNYDSIRELKNISFGK